MAFDQDLTCLIFPFQWAGFPIKIGRNAQWEHLFSMDFDGFSTIYLFIYFYSNKNISIYKCELDMFYSSMAELHQNIKRFIQMKVHFRWHHIPLSKVYGFPTE